MVVGENNRASNIMDGIENTGDVRLHDHRLRLKQRFDIVRKLGQGTYGKVQLGINKKTGQEVAIKTIKKCKIESEADLVRIRREVQIMSSVRHPNIVHIYEVFENSEKMILVMEYCPGGELYDYLSKKKVLQEDEARRLFRQIATAVYYCHIHKICHRDLKLENVLLDETGSAKIADFGLSNVFKETSVLSTFCGSPLYASPEIVKGTPYIGPEVDCWSLGVLLYTLVYGAMPFDGSNFKRLVRQISNGDYYEPKTPSTASPLIRDMLTVDPVKRADIVYICDHSWVNSGCQTSCLEVAEALAAETPVRLDLLLSLAPQAPRNSNSFVVPPQTELGPEESCTDLTSSTSMAVEPSNSAEKRILELVAEGGEDAIKPSPTRTIVSAGENKRKLELAMSASGLQRKKERVASCASIAPQEPLPEEPTSELPPPEEVTPAETPPQPTLKSSATITIQPSPAPVSAPLVKDATKDILEPKEDKGAKARVTANKKISPTKSVEEKSPEKDEPKPEETKQSSVASAADKLTSLSISNQNQAQPATANQTPAKPKKLSIPGGNVGNFKEQFERRASLTTAPPEVKRNVSKPAVSKIAKPKAQSEDRELPTKTQDNGTVRLQQIGIEPSPVPSDEHPNRGNLKKTESEPTHGTSAVDPSVLLQDARRSLQNSMAKLVEEKVGEESRRRAARDIISTAIRTGKPPVPYGRSSSAGVTSLSSVGMTSLSSPPATPPAAPPATPPAAPRLFRTEAQHRVEDHRNRGVSVERIIPINLPPEETPSTPPAPAQAQPKPAPTAAPRLQTPVRRLVSNESNTSEACSSPGEPIKKSAREFIIPIAVEGKGYVTPRQRSLEPGESSSGTRLGRPHKPRRISSLVSGGESEEEDDTQMHRLRSSRAARAESVSSGEEDEEDEGFHLLTAENLFSTLLHRVRALTNRLNGEEGPGFTQHPHSLFNNLQSPFFNSPHLPRRSLLREGWGSRDLHADFDSMFNKSRASPRGHNKKSKLKSESGDVVDSGLDLSDLDLSSIELSEGERRALSGLTPGLSRRLARQLLASLPPRQAQDLRRTCSLQGQPRPPSAAAAPAPPHPPSDPPQYCTLPRLKRNSTLSRETTPVNNTDDLASKPTAPATREPSQSRASSIRSTPDRPLLSKYLTPERTLSLDDSYSSDTGSILSEPSYIAAYGVPTASSIAGLRRHSMRLTGDQPRKRISRFLRSDFFDTPPDENLYTKHKKEKELETQKILREIREKKNKALESSAKNPTDANDSINDDANYSRKCLSPISPITILAGKERSRSITPFFPILDNIKETTSDSSFHAANSKHTTKPEDLSHKHEDSILNIESKLIRPKSFPVKTQDSYEEPNENISHKESEIKENNKTLPRESKLKRPKSYPASSPSPEKVYVNRNNKKDDLTMPLPKDKLTSPETKSDVEVSFSITLPRKSIKACSSKTDILKKTNSIEATNDPTIHPCDANLVLKKYSIVNINDDDKSEKNYHKSENDITIANGGSVISCVKADNNEDSKIKVTNHAVKKEEVKLKSTDADTTEKKGTIKKKIIKKVSSKTKTDVGSVTEGTNESKPVSEKKKVTKKVKTKSCDDGIKTTVTKKKSVLQSIGHKLEKFASNKANSPEKNTDHNATRDTKKECNKMSRTEREHSVPVNAEPPTESNLIKRAVTLTDVAALDSQPPTPSKTTVSKVLGLFKKFESKDKPIKPPIEKSLSLDQNRTCTTNNLFEPVTDNVTDSNEDKPKRPTSLLLNGMGRKKYSRTVSDTLNTTEYTENNDQTVLKKGNSSKNLRNSLKLDFSRLPRVKKVVPTNSVIEPLIMNTNDDDKVVEKKQVTDKNGSVPVVNLYPSLETVDTLSRSRSRSRSTYSNSELKSDNSADTKSSDKTALFSETSVHHHPVRNHESTTPDKEDVVDRIRRKSFYSRFNEKKHRRKSNLVGPGATEYDPLARIHSPPTDTKFDISPTSPGTYDLSPGYSVASDFSPSTERYRSLITDLPSNTRNPRYDTYGLNDKIDTYRSLDRNEFRKYPGTRSYLEYDQPTSYTAHRYSRTKSLLDSSDGTEDHSMSSLKDSHKYNRTLSMYSPGSYATYRPKRTRNSAIILKESEKEPSPENILDKIRQRKKNAISVTRKTDFDKDSLSRSDVTPKSEGNGAECSEKID